MKLWKTFFINEALEYIPLVIAYFIKDAYLLEKNAHDSFNEESLFTHKNNDQVWIVGLINNISRKIKLEIFVNSSRKIKKIIITKLIPKGNIIITDLVSCYSWIDDIYRLYSPYP